MKINLLDLFSGIGGFHLGLKKAGFKINSYNSEIDKYAIEVYKHNFKNSTHVGSVADIQKKNLPKIDAITFGSPCQDFSMAGKRKGMQGSRSSLISEAIRLITECKPRFFIWENVKGTFSSNSGEDFWAIIQAFANIRNYRLEWQLLNTNWFLPQNRERIYLVGYIGDGSKGQIFPITETDFNFTKKIRNKTGQTTSKQNRHTRTISSRIHQMGSDDSYIKVKSNTKIGSVRIGDYRNDEGYRERKNGDAPTLTLRSGDTTIVNKIRRLTPIECERLQGFPDNWTKYGTQGIISDSQRYKMCGNAVTVDVVKEVAKNILKII